MIERAGDTVGWYDQKIGVKEVDVEFGGYSIRTT